MKQRSLDSVRLTKGRHHSKSGPGQLDHISPGKNSMALSRQALGFLTFIIIVGGLGAGMYFRLRTDPEEDRLRRHSPKTPRSSLSRPPSSSPPTFPNPWWGRRWSGTPSGSRCRRRARPRRSVATAVSSRVDGIVKEILVQENRSVPAGGLLLQVDTTEYALALARARADYVSAEARYEEMIFFDDEITDPAVREERARLSRARSGLAQAEVTLQEATLNLAQTAVRLPSRDGWPTCGWWRASTWAPGLSS